MADTMPKNGPFAPATNEMIEKWQVQVDYCGKIVIGPAGEHLLAERLGAAVEGAVVLAEGEVGRVGLGEARAVGAGAGVDAAGGDVAPGHARVGAGLRHEAGQDGVAQQALALVQFAGVDVGLAGVPGGVDEKLRPVAAQRGGEQRRVGVVELGPAQVAKRDAPAREQRLVRVADIAGTSEQVDHGRRGGQAARVAVVERLGMSATLIFSGNPRG